MTRRRLALPIALACLALTACGTPGASDGPAFYAPDPEDFYPTGTVLGSDPPPETPACLRASGRGLPSERAFAGCRRELEVHEAVLREWSRRIADAVEEESRRNNERALAALACKLGGGPTPHE